jgi:hypothetical protein
MLLRYGKERGAIPFLFVRRVTSKIGVDFSVVVWYNIGVKEREVMTMAKFPMDKRVKVDSNEYYDFYIMHCGRDWYVEAFPIGTLDHTRKTLAGFSKLKVAKECVESWKGWMKPRGIIK